MSLLFPAYLLGLFGLSLPWLLHRFSDQDPPQHPFPTSRFLDATNPPVSRKRTLRYKLLLSLRILALCLLCLLFAQPWLNDNAINDNPAKHHIIAIDQSLSMRAGQRWDQAQQEAKRLIDSLGASDSIELVGFDRQVRVVGSNVQQTADLSALLEDLQPGYDSADYGVLMQRINKLATEHDLPVKLWLVSDLQKSALPSQLNALYAPNINDLELIAVQASDSFNIHLTATANISDGVNVDISTALQMSTDSQASPSSQERTVAVEFEGKQLASRRVTLLPGELEVINFTDIVLPAQSNPVLNVRLLESDALPDDDQQYLLMGQSQPAAIVLLQPAGSVDNDAAVFVRTALETEDVASVESVRGSADQVSEDTSHIVAGRGFADAVDLDILQFVDMGRNALIFNTDKVAPIDLDETLITGSSISEVDEAHPLALGEIDWFGVNFYNLPEVKLASDDRVLLKTGDQQVVLFERPTNRGRLLVLNDPLDGNASDLPLQPAFVTMVRSIIEYFDANTSIPTDVTVGDRVALPANVQVLDPDEKPMVSLGESSSVSSVQFTEPGLHTVVGNRGEQGLHVRLDAQEADISTLPAATVDAWKARYDERASTDDSLQQAEPVATVKRQLSAAGEQLRESMWKWIFPLFAIALLSESVYANRRLGVRRDGS